MKMMKLLIFSWMLPFVGCAHAASVESAPYAFLNFEDRQVFPTGPLQGGAQGLQTMTQGAWIADGAVKDESRHLSVSGALVLSGQRFTADGLTHLELWAKPHCSSLGDASEFLDFDGAVLGLFEADEGKAEFHALHITEADQGYWISTGSAVPVSNGVCESWHRINITQDWARGTWSVSVDGTPLLEGIGRGSCAEGNRFELWMYGTSKSEVCAFDDVLISSLPPDILEASLRTRTWQPHQPSARSVKRVVGKSSDAARRQHREPRPDSRKASAITILSMNLQVVGGGRHIGEFESKEKSGEVKKFALYTPGYDENGKPKPLEVRIRCDATLSVGASLADIEWAITEMPKDGQTNARVIVHGTFEKGPTLVATVPSDWSNKPLSIQCGSRGLVQPRGGQGR